MKTAERVVIVGILILLLGGSVWLYFSITALIEQERTIPEPITSIATTSESAAEVRPDWRVYYPVTNPITIGSTTVLASVAETVPERIKGLSDTPFLPENVVKLFVFGAEGSHSIWMKDMQYPLDIMWAAKTGEIVHIEENVSPDTFPESFSSPVPAWYVIEANAGFVAEQGIQLGDAMTRVES